MEFKKLEIEQEGTWFKRTIQSPQTKKTVIYTIIGAIGGLIYFYLGEAKQIDIITLKDVVPNVLIGAFLGFFITNSPCARGRC